MLNCFDQLIALSSRDVVNHALPLIALSVIGTIYGVTATTIYGSVLLAMDIIGTIVHGIRQDLAKKRLRPIVAVSD